MESATLSEGLVTGDVRGWLRAEGLAVFGLSVLVYGRLGASWWVFSGLFLAPDLSMLGYLINARVGGWSYNLVHSYLLPLGAAVVALAANRNYSVSFLCIWTAHIGMDRLLGFGLKYPSEFAKTHLGMLGRGPR